MKKNILEVLLSDEVRQATVQAQQEEIRPLVESIGSLVEGMAAARGFNSTLTSPCVVPPKDVAVQTDVDLMNEFTVDA